MQSIFSKIFRCLELKTSFRTFIEHVQTIPSIHCFSWFGNKHFQLAILFLFATVFLSGCPKPQPVIKTHYEYVPPLTEGGLACTRSVRQKFNDCLGMDRLQADVCRKQEERAAWKRYEQAQVRYENALGQAKIDREKKSIDKQDQHLSDLAAYEECEAENLNRKAEHDMKVKLWAEGDRKNMKPVLYDWDLRRCNRPSAPVQKYEDQQLYVSVPKPVLQDYVNDGHCYGNSGCLNQYNIDYERCNGKVITKSRCFINCE